MRGLRGATTVEENTAEAIWSATQEVVREMLKRNNVEPEDIGAAIFSATEDITAAFPASGARKLPGFDAVPLFDARQMDVDGAMEKCIRVLLLVDTPLKQREIQHVFLGKAASLRPDLTGKK
ncbi:Chorismate mutase II [Anaerovibrio sp. JC8]|uniref:chorismate mutase n=1 Tax=Anaerovibrio sp. JC8 TaxID=1240085 RepID=UPI000A0CE950|nr:chorismate mutase [Anaerovibrio sp. JC8]ORU00368.1 Chorismate mutase II [Anaerovibrio sp. JC8]